MEPVCPNQCLFSPRAGIDALNELDKIFLPKSLSANALLSEILFKRLPYVGLETPTNLIILGKTWSIYKMTYSTDRFDVDDGQASRIYNTGTDGSQTGTGRANMACKHAGKSKPSPSTGTQAPQSPKGLMSLFLSRIPKSARDMVASHIERKL